MKIIIQRHFNVFFGVCEFRVAGVIIGKDSCLSSLVCRCCCEKNARLISKIDAVREQFNTTEYNREQNKDMLSLKLAKRKNTEPGQNFTDCYDKSVCIDYRSIGVFINSV